MRIICHNHQETQSISDILRLYYEEFHLVNSQIIEVTDSGELNLPDILHVAVDQPVVLEQMRDPADQTEIEVLSFVEQRDLKIKSKVIPSAMRREIKRQVYYLLSNLLQIYYPWGSLTGIRPTQIAYRAYIENRQDFDAAKQALIKYWFVSPEKVDIGLQTAISEMQVMDSCEPHQPMLYIGIPFCRTRCAYCSFITRDATSQTANLSFYVDCLLREIGQFSKFMREQGKVFQAIYVGGGTPTALPEQDFERLMKTILREIPVTSDCEFTVEAGRPDSINQTKLEAIKMLPKVRICINPQTMHDRTLQLIGRDHNVEQVLTAFSLARQLKFESINMDLILGLPGESGADFLLSLDRLFELDPESITIHSLALKRSAYLEEKFQQKYRQLRFPDRELSDSFSEAIRRLKQRGYLPYYMYRQKNVRAGLENIGFAKKGHECKYNVGMMSDLVSVVGLGSGSSTKFVQGSKVDRIVNPKDLMVYADRISEITGKKIDFFNS